MGWRWPLDQVPSLPGAQGRFGAARRHDVHSGVDLYAPPRAVVRAVETGVVVAVDPLFTGGPDSPWWQKTAAVMVEGASGVVLYGEVAAGVGVGQEVSAGEAVGEVAAVLRERPGKAYRNPLSMLHLELYGRGARAAAWWLPGARPEGLLDPTGLLEAAAAGPPGVELAAVGVLRNCAGEVLLLRRHPCDREVRGWCLPGGKVGAGEPLSEALPREFREETGIEVSFGPYLGVYRAGRFEIHVFAAEAAGGSLRQDFPTAEHAEAAWVSPRAAAALELAGPVTAAVLAAL